MANGNDWQSLGGMGRLQLMPQNKRSYNIFYILISITCKHLWSHHELRVSINRPNIMVFWSWMKRLLVYLSIVKRLRCNANIEGSVEIDEEQLAMTFNLHDEHTSMFSPSRCSWRAQKFNKYWSGTGSESFLFRMSASVQRERRKEMRSRTGCLFLNSITVEKSINKTGITRNNTQVFSEKNMTNRDEN